MNRGISTYGNFARFLSFGLGLNFVRKDISIKSKLKFFSIALHAQVAVVTKAKLDEVSVKGDCKCEEDDTVLLT